ncbi:MAG: T9SS type A sorting domain-containing protein, partial [Bacteroides sp.]
NPFIAQLRLVCNGATGRYDLLNAQGVVVRSGNMDGNEVMIETTDLPTGLYLLHLIATNGATKVVTIVKD